MTIKEAVMKALEDWACSPDFDLNEYETIVETLVMGAFDEFAEQHGYSFDEDSGTYVKEARQ